MLSVVEVKVGKAQFNPVLLTLGNQALHGGQPSRIQQGHPVHIEDNHPVLVTQGTQLTKYPVGRGKEQRAADLEYPSFRAEEEKSIFFILGDVGNLGHLGDFFHEQQGSQKNPGRDRNHHIKQHRQGEAGENTSMSLRGDFEQVHRLRASLMFQATTISNAAMEDMGR